jgi:hypothetical protein
VFPTVSMGAVGASKVVMRGILRSFERRFRTRYLLAEQREGEVTVSVTNTLSPVVDRASSPCSSHACMHARQ